MAWNPVAYYRCSISEEGRDVLLDARDKLVVFVGVSLLRCSECWKTISIDVNFARRVLISVFYMVPGLRNLTGASAQHEGLTDVTQVLKPSSVFKASLEMPRCGDECASSTTHALTHH